MRRGREVHLLSLRLYSCLVMTQKPLGKKAVFDAKKAKVANRHGKVHKQRKGEWTLLAPRSGILTLTRLTHLCCAHAGGREFTNTKESKEDADVRTVRLARRGVWATTPHATPPSRTWLRPRAGDHAPHQPAQRAGLCS